MRGINFKGREARYDAIKVFNGMATELSISYRATIG